jgi:hypothetical protein
MSYVYSLQNWRLRQALQHLANAGLHCRTMTYRHCCIISQHHISIMLPVQA